MKRVSATRLPKDLLFDLLPAALEPWGTSGLFPSRPPTEESVRRIEAELGLVCPPLLIEVARACPAYGGWLGSFGDDFDSRNHVLAINGWFREGGLPARYVLLNHGHDGDCDAWDREGAVTGTELPIVYFELDLERTQLRSLRAVATTFADYIDGFVRIHAPRCPVKGLRRRAKRALAEFDAKAVEQ